MAKAIVQDGVIMGIGASEAAAYRVAETISLDGGLYQLDASAVCVHASDEALRDCNENGADASVYLDDAGSVRSWREAANDVLAGERWVVLVDRKPRPEDPLFFAVSQEQAIRMWRHHTGLHAIHKGRLSAVPESALASGQPWRPSHATEATPPAKPSLVVGPLSVTTLLDALGLMFLESEYFPLHMGDRLDITGDEDVVHASVRVVDNCAVVTPVGSGKRAVRRAAKVAKFLASRLEQAKAKGR